MARISKTIDDYLATVSGPRKAVLVRLHKTIRSIVPDAEECISYGIPAFRLDGRVVAGFAARADGCSYFPFSGTTLTTLQGVLDQRGMAAEGPHRSPLSCEPTSRRRARCTSTSRSR